MPPRAASATRALARTETFMPMKPAAAEKAPPIRKPIAVSDVERDREHDREHDGHDADDLVLARSGRPARPPARPWRSSCMRSLPGDLASSQREVEQRRRPPRRRRNERDDDPVVGQKVSQGRVLRSSGGRSRWRAPKRSVVRLRSDPRHRPEQERAQSIEVLGEHAKAASAETGSTPGIPPGPRRSRSRAARRRSRARARGPASASGYWVMSTTSQPARREPPRLGAGREAGAVRSTTTVPPSTTSIPSSRAASASVRRQLGAVRVGRRDVGGLRAVVEGVLAALACGRRTGRRSRTSRGRSAQRAAGATGPGSAERRRCASPRRSRGS